jgi:hypothetical protein
MIEEIKLQRALVKVYRQSPILIGGLAVDFYKQSFKRQGFIDKSYERWPGRVRQDKNKRRRAVGVKTGRLRRSIRVRAKTQRYVYIATDVPYAQRFNEGFTGTVNQSVKEHKVRKHRRRQRGKNVTVKEHTRSAHKRTLKVSQEARTFMGKSRFLEKRIEKNLEAQIKKELKFLKRV